MELTPGKLWGMRRLADAEGRYKMVAVDQRLPIFGPIAAARGLNEPPYDDLAAVKTLLTRHLAPASSAVLMDPLFAYPRAIPELPAAKGLMLALEHSAFEETPGGRRSRPIPDWSVAKIRRLGGDGVKVLIWHRHDAAPEVREHQRRFIEEVGARCAEHDLVFLLEILVYPLPGEGAMAPETRAERVLAAIEDYADRRFGVDIYKLESPIGIADIPDPEGSTAAARRARALFERMAQLVDRPWVMLSAGAGAEEFARLLAYAYEAGASGYLAGRAIWWEAFRHFPDLAAMERALAADAVPYMRRINELTDRRAAPWTAHPSFAGGCGLADTGPGFPSRYDAPPTMR